MLDSVSHTGGLYSSEEAVAGKGEMREIYHSARRELCEKSEQGGHLCRNMLLGPVSGHW